MSAFGFNTVEKSVSQSTIQTIICNTHIHNKHTVQQILLLLLKTHVLAASSPSVYSSVQKFGYTMKKNVEDSHNTGATNLFSKISKALPFNAFYRNKCDNYPVKNRSFFFGVPRLLAATVSVAFFSYSFDLFTYVYFVRFMFLYFNFLFRCCLSMFHLFGFYLCSCCCYCHCCCCFCCYRYGCYRCHFLFHCIDSVHFSPGVIGWPSHTYKCEVQTKSIRA